MTMAKKAAKKRIQKTNSKENKKIISSLVMLYTSKLPLHSDKEKPQNYDSN